MKKVSSKYKVVPYLICGHTISNYKLKKSSHKDNGASISKGKKR